MIDWLILLLLTSSSFRPTLQGSGEDGDQAARGVPLRPGAARGRDARHPGHDARGHQAEQGQDHPAAPQRVLEVLESQHSMEGQYAFFATFAMGKIGVLRH